MSKIARFEEEYPSLDSYWRSIILFGKNSASYKFALAKSLLEIVPTGKTEISLEELALPFSKHLCEHLKKAPKQGTSARSQFLEACNNFNQEIITHDELIDITVKKGFNNVIDAFHNVNNSSIPVQFYDKDYSSRNKKIILTDDLFKLQQLPYFKDFDHEAEARWNLVETAWELGVAKNLLSVNYDDNHQLFFVNQDLKRKDVTSARDALNGYQKGRCFYCFDDITIDSSNENLCDVDHFYPHMLQPSMPEVNLNGVWNLVLACPKCNRGMNGKFAAIPATKYLERLHKRNEYLINSHHPLRETLMMQTGMTEEQRVHFLKTIDKFAINRMRHRWETEQVKEPTF